MTRKIAVHAHRWLVAALVGASLFASAPSQASSSVSQPTGWGLGLMLSFPTGITAKQWLGGPNAWDSGVGVGPGVRLHADYLWGLAQLLPNTSDATLDAYLGAGPVVGVARGWCGLSFDPGGACEGGPLFAGGRVPVGLDLRLRRAPLDLGLEVAPGLWLAPSPSGLLDAFLFVRVLL